MDRNPKYKKGDYLFVQLQGYKYLMRIVGFKDDKYLMLHENYIRKGITNMDPVDVLFVLIDTPVKGVTVKHVDFKDLKKYMLLYF